MNQDFWRKQTVDKPLFPDMLWSRPENAAFAGKLLIVGGNLYGFSNPAIAFGAARQAGIGRARVLLPDTLEKSIARSIPKSQMAELNGALEFAPSTPSGSFSQRALGELLPMAAWSDAVLLSGDLGRNSETAILLEKFSGNYHGQLVMTCDAADYFTQSPAAIMERSDTLWVISLAQLQKLATGVRFPTAFTYGMDMLRFVDALHDFSARFPGYFVVKHFGTIFTAVDGEVTSTRLTEDPKVWRLKTATHTAVWWLQNPSKPLEALSTGIISAWNPNALV